MGTGYTRADTLNNIADGNIINASDIDSEYDAIEAAFNETTGHTHDGTAAEGAPITVLGPVQDFIASATEIKPKTTNTLDIGTVSLQFKDMYLDGTAYIDGLGEDILVATDKKVQFRDTALFINSSADGQLDIDADVELELVAPTVDIDASTAVTIDTATLTVTGSANVVGDLDVDNININGNTISSTDTNGNLTIDPNGTGNIVLDANVGIGTTSPYSYGKLTIEGGNGTQLVLDNAGEQYTQMYFLNNGTDKGSIWVDNSLSLFSFVARSGIAMNFYANNSEAMRIDTSGNVGIGTSSPSHKLNVRGGRSVFQANSDLYSIQVEGASGAGQYYIGATNEASPSLVFSNVGGTERLRIDSSGNVGIGTSSPGSKLNVISATSGGIAIAQGTENFYGASAHRFYTDGYASEVLHINSSGNVGIGTSSPDLTGFGSGTNGLEIADATLAGIRLNGNAADSLYLISGASKHWIFGRGAVPLTFSTDGTERMRIDSSGNVGIGTTSPTHNLTVGSTASSDFVVALRGGVGGFFGWDDSANTTVLQAPNTRSLSFQVNSDTFSSGTEAMRITSGGNVFFGCTAFPSASVAGFTINGTSSGNASSSGASTAAYNHLLFYNGNGIVGYISTSGSTTTYSTSSDYRLKTAVTYDWDATTRLKQLRPARFEWIADGDDAVPVDGFLAHEVQTVVPEAITGTHNGMRDEEYEVSAATGDIYTPAIEAVLDEDGNEVTSAVAEVIHSTDVERPEELAEGQQWRETTAAVMGTRSVPDYQGIDQSKLTPLLTKALIEAVEKIEQLEARIAALEAN